MVIGEVLCEILLERLTNCVLESPHGKIYDYKTNTWNSTLSEIFGEISQCHDIMVRRRERLKIEHDAFESYTVSVLDETSQETKLSVETRAALHAVFRKFFVKNDSGEIAVLNDFDCKDSFEALRKNFCLSGWM